MAKKKLAKKSTISKTKKYPGQEKSLRLTPKVQPDPEESDILGEDEVEEAEVDAADPDPLLGDLEGADVPLDPNRHAHIKYPPPRKDSVFVKRWRELISSIAGRENFNTGHLYQLQVLCDLYVEYEDLAKYIRTHGQTYVAFGRQGKAIKPYPQVNQMNRVKAEIRNYSKMLGLLLVKDKDPTNPREGESWA